MKDVSFESRSHLIEELFSIANRKTLKSFLENLNEDLEEDHQVDIDGSIREIGRVLMLISLDKLQENFHATFNEDESDEDETEEDEDSDEEE